MIMAATAHGNTPDRSHTGMAHGYKTITGQQQVGDKTNSSYLVQLASLDQLVSLGQSSLIRLLNS